MSPALAGGFVATEPPGKPPSQVLFVWKPLVNPGDLIGQERASCVLSECLGSANAISTKDKAKGPDWLQPALSKAEAMSPKALHQQGLDTLSELPVL